MRKVTVTAALLLAFLLVVFVPQAMCDISSLDRFLPTDTMLYLVVKDVDAAKEKARETAFYEVWGSEGMQALRAEMSTLWGKTIVSKIQIDPLTFVRAIKKDAVLGAALHYDPALGLPKGLSVSVALVVDDPDGEIKQIVSSMKTLMRKEKDSFPSLKMFEHGDAAVLTLQSEDDKEVSLATPPGTFLFCYGAPGLVTTLIDQGSKQEPSGFPTSAMYPSLQGLYQEGDLALAWLDWKTLVQTAQSLIQTTTKNKVNPAVLFSHIGIDNLSSYYLRTYIDHRGFFRQQVVGFEGPIHGLLQFFLSPGELNAVDRFTPETDFVMDLSIGPPLEAWQRLKDMVLAVWGKQAQTGMTTGVQAFETMLGFSFEQDLFPSIGNELAMGFQGKEATFLLKVLDEEKIAEIVPKLLLIWELKPEPIQAEGVTYNRVQLTGADLALYYGMDRGYLAVSNSPEGYLRAVKKTKKESIVASRRYGKPLSYLPPANSFLTITDLRGMADYSATVMGLERSISKGKAPSGLDLSFLGEETYPIVDAGVVQEDRFIRWSYSESGMEGILTAFSLLQTVGRQMTQATQGETRKAVSRAQADLRTLTIALESYFLDNSRYPDALNQLLKPISYLAKVPTDPWTGKPYVYEQRENTYILIGAGPDGKVDLDRRSIQGPFSKEKIPETARYDESKGKQGDIIRVGP